jgi:hypothetical protein
MRRRDRFVLPGWAPWLALLPIAFLLIGDQLNTNLGWHENIADVAATAPPARMEAIGRTRMLAAMLPFMLASTLITFYFAYEFARLMGSRMRRQISIVIGLFGASSLFFLAYQLGEDSPADGSILGRGFLDAAFARVPANSPVIDWLVWAFDERVPMVATLHLLVLLFTLFLVFGAGAAIAGTISCVARPIRRASPTPGRSLAFRRRCADQQKTRLDRYLYASAFLLVTGLFFMDAAFRWAGPFAADRNLFMEHVDALMLSNGIYYSVVLASYYLPAAALAGRFSAATAEPPDAAGSESGDSPNLAERMSPSRLLKSMLALLAPAIAGILTQVIEGAGL